MSFFDRWRRSNPEKAFQAGREAGERLREREPDLGAKPYAHAVIALGRLADQHGLTIAESKKFECGVYEGYTCKVYCGHPDCCGYYLPHEH